MSNTLHTSRFTLHLSRGLPLLAIVALGAVAAQAPLGPGLPCSDDIGFHLFRLTQLDALVRQGILYSRWAPDMARGYGYPIFNFVPPLPYYLALLLSRLGLGLNLGLRFTLALTFWAAGLATYRLARDHFGAWASLVAAVACMAAPYLAYNALFRGNLAEAVAAPLLPLTLWLVGRAVRQGGRGWLVGAALAYAAVLLTHNIFTVIASPLIGLYLLVEALAVEGGWRRSLGAGARGVAALAFGLGLAAFFWLPAFVERTTVHIERLHFGPPFAYWNHYLPLQELAAGWQAIQPDWINPAPPRTLGLIPVLLGLPGLAGLLMFDGSRRRQVACFGAALLGYGFLMTAAAHPLWQRLSLLQLVEFPWRMLGPAALCLALLTGATVELLPRGKGRRLAGGIMVVALLLAAGFWLDARYCTGYEQPTLADMQTFEAMTGLIGTTSAGEYLPRTVDQLPAAPAGDFFAPGPTLSDVETGPLSGAAWLETSTPLTLTVNRLAFAGWRAWIDGQPVAWTPDASGLITVPVPAGRQRIAVRFGETPLRLAADGLSLLALLGLLGLWRWGPRVTVRMAGTPERLGWAALALPLLALTLREGIVGRVESPLRYHRLRAHGLAGVAVPLSMTYAGQLWLWGLETLPTPWPADQPLPLKLYWQDTVPGGPNVWFRPDLTDATGEVWSGYPYSPTWYRFPPPTSEWRPDGYVTTEFDVQPFPGTPPGLYTVTLTVFDKTTLAPLTVYGTDGRALGPALTLGQVTLTAPHVAASPAEVGGTETGPVWGALRLVKAEPLPVMLRPGDALRLLWHWQVLEAPTDNLQVQLRLMDAAGETAAAWELPPVRADFPTGQWQAGELWRAHHQVRLPAGLASGEYRLLLTLCAVEGEDCRALETPVALGTLPVQAPARLWTAPPLAEQLAMPLGDVATLWGVQLTPEPTVVQPGATFTVTLVWRSEAETPVSYRVFVHLLAPEGALVAQSDGEPAAWSRPTTGWLPGEFVVDERTLTLPAEAAPGVYHLWVGLYAPDGTRLLTPAGADAVEVGTVLVKE